MRLVQLKDNAQADARQIPFILVSINIANEGFYNYHGFQSVGEALIGKDNPTWGGPILPVQIVRTNQLQK